MECLGEAGIPVESEERVVSDKNAAQKEKNIGKSSNIGKNSKETMNTDIKAEMQEQKGA